MPLYQIFLVIFLLLYLIGYGLGRPYADYDFFGMLAANILFFLAYVVGKRVPWATKYIVLLMYVELMTMRLLVQWMSRGTENERDPDLNLWVFSYLLVTMQVLAFDWLFQSIAFSIIYLSAICIQYLTINELDVRQFLMLLILAISMALTMALALRLSMQWATTMFLKNVELEQRDRELVSLFDALTEGIMVIEEKDDKFEVLFKN